MMYQHKDIAKLIIKSLQSDLSETEQELLLQWLEESPERKDWFNQLNANESFAEETIYMFQSDRMQIKQDLYLRICNEIGLSPKVRPLKKNGSASKYAHWLKIAAVLLLFISLSYYAWNHFIVIVEEPRASKALNEKIEPGTDGAILTLADGRQIVLDSLENKRIALEDGSFATLQKNQIVFPRANENYTENNIHRISTPRGRQYKVILPDGSVAWLNASSSLAFQSNYAEHNRDISITGEVFFDVAKNKKHPFRVFLPNDNQIEVLGTSFNVRSYLDDDLVTTTLLTGSLRFSSPNGYKMNQHILKPGERATFRTKENNEFKIEMLEDPSVEKAWVDGLFSFDGASIAQLMKQIERWYNIEVIFQEETLPHVDLKGEITSDVSIEELIVALNKLGIPCHLKNRTLYINKN
ncbi:FecR family protein [Sphingobacterium sp. BN32]|uniref:FecR family protein n=1 Tax=Sphingobacterium sp. BN32 TaxID=3058432 RepID=UPI00265CA436|nr:FecR family protein [Sphingobacterium sp. BN32]WKK59250.1 FecR domain-containing protein [Sphingobacterium sp. BN32]